MYDLSDKIVSNSKYISKEFRSKYKLNSYTIFPPSLTNLKKEDWERITAQKLSPLFISVHATDPKIREKLLKNKKAGEILDQMAKNVSVSYIQTVSLAEG